MGVAALKGRLVAPLHQIEEAHQRGLDEFLVRVPAILGRKPALADGVIVAGVLL